MYLWQNSYIVLEKYYIKGVKNLIKLDEFNYESSSITCGNLFIPKDYH